MLLFKSCPSSDCILETNRIDVWRFSLETDPASLPALLSIDEMNTAGRFHFAHHRRRYTVSRTLLRLILGDYLKQDAAQLPFSYNTHGKPFLEDPSLIQFNLSHSRDTAMLAIGKRHPLGIDLEYFSSRPYDGIAHHLFSSKEYDALQALPGSLKPMGFFHLWSQKEALIKACGLGLSYPTTTVSLPMLSSRIHRVEDMVHNKTWQIQSFMPTMSCWAALCYSPEIDTFRYFTRDLQAGHDVTFK